VRATPVSLLRHTKHRDANGSSVMDVGRSATRVDPSAAPRCRASLGRERGSVAVEFALVLPLLLVLVFGMIDFGIAFANYEGVRSGTREAARLGVVNDVSNAPSCTIDGATVTPPANPTSPSDATNALVCLTKDRVGLSGSATKVKLTITGQAVGDELQVCASFNVTAVTGYTVLFLGNQTLTSSVTMRLEQVPLFTSYTEPGGAC
jgi:Flp pilus assembly protein TadG